MQTITMHLRASSVKATHVDEWNQPVSTPPALTRGLRAELVLKLLDANGAPLGPEQLGYAAWDFAVADDWDTETTPQLRVTEGITVEGNEVHVPLLETNTEELVAALGRSEQRTFGCELAGFAAGETSPEFLIQFDIVIRNRRADAGSGTPVPVEDGGCTVAQVRALLASRVEAQISRDGGGTWEDADPESPMPDGAALFRFRSSAAQGEWSDALPLVQGPSGTIEIESTESGESGEPARVWNEGDARNARLHFRLPRGERGLTGTIDVYDTVTGEPGSEARVENVGTQESAQLRFTIPRGSAGPRGDSAYVYVAYASRSDGAGFSLEPSSSRPYRAEIHPDGPIESPTAADFAGAAWVKYLGDDATVYGDILVADADTSVGRVTRIVFENARIRRGIDGEVIVNFREAGVTDEEFDRYAVVNGRTRLSSWTNGGGSPSATPGLEVMTPFDVVDPAPIENHSTFTA